MFGKLRFTDFALVFMLIGYGGSGVLANPINTPHIGVTAALRGEVVRTASLEIGAAIGQMSSGQTVFLGDDIKVGPKGRLQVMLLDETIFTLGANSLMRIDRFVYDPEQPDNSALTTSIKKGAFRFVSGQIAKARNNAMTVKLPSASIGVRGTSVAGDIAADGSASVILLGPAQDNRLGLPPGAIEVANAAGTVELTRPGFVTQIDPSGQAPAPPVQATPTQIRNLERALAEEASSELAEGLGLEVSEIAALAGDDTDGDGQLDSFKANENLSAAIRGATGTKGAVTNNAVLIEQVANTLFGEENLADLSDKERADMFRGLNLGEDIADLLAGDFDYLGPTTLADLADFGPNGRVTFTGTGAALTDSNGAASGEFDLRQVWDFANSEVSSTIGGTFALADRNGQVLSGTFDNTATQVMDFSTARGIANVSFATSFSTSPGETQSDPAAFNDPHVFGEVGGNSYDRSGNLEIAGEAARFHGPGAQSQDGSVLEPRLSAFATLDEASRQTMIDNGNYQLDVRVDSNLANVDRKDGTPSTASIGEGSVDITLRDHSLGPAGAEGVNRAEGRIFAMKRTISE